ncbi:hypothetical protein L1049_020227 [Liquidambar formosana]|uniref:Disease resistance R13L4/SHOC-2-like LRR domain-containing protein n=1 Tax=Liquidambar formosana TaxID=63359 RepID=A0AAP0S6V5_LIQFO
MKLNWSIQCSTEERLRNCPAISLPYGKIHELPPGLKCPKLKLLLLLSNDRSLTIPDTFFEGMKQLKVLDLTNIRFSTLPSSLNFLSNLQTLCLDKCELRDIANFGELKKLEVLSFASSDIEELPKEIGELTRLKLLDLSDFYKLKVIPSNVNASLSQLEDLYMKSRFVEWEIDGNVSLGELKHLSHLVTLDIHIQDANILPKDLRFEKLMRYRIFVGDAWHWYGVYETSRTLKLKLNTNIQQFRINMLLERTEDLY